MKSKPGFVFTNSEKSKPGFVSDAWVLAHRGPKAVLDPARAYATDFEEERDAGGDLAPTAVIFLTNRECPFRCVMCDLWLNTLDRPLAPGAIPGQIRVALAELPPARQIKLYNAGSFFDPGAIPPADHAEIASIASGYARVIVEAHPAFLEGLYGERCLRFRDGLLAASASHDTACAGQSTSHEAAWARESAARDAPRAPGARLEVAVGLETANAEVLAKLNKRMTLDSFSCAADFLTSNDIDLRVFILLRPPFMDEETGVEWACRSLDFAAARGATACSIIPTRGGNGAMEALGGAAREPSLRSLERVLEYGLSLGGLRVFADLWDAARFYECGCAGPRTARLREMNQRQRVVPAIACECDVRL